MFPEMLAALIVLVAIPVGLLSAFGAAAIAVGPDSRRDESGISLSPWR